MLKIFHYIIQNYYYFYYYDILMCALYLGS